MIIEAVFSTTDWRTHDRHSAPAIEEPALSKFPVLTAIESARPPRPDGLGSGGSPRLRGAKTVELEKAAARRTAAMAQFTRNGPMGRRRPPHILNPCLRQVALYATHT